jgi:hypothetical protein
MASHQKKDFNFYQRYQQKPARKWGFWPIYTVVMVLFVLVASGASYWFYAENKTIQTEIRDLERSYLENPLALAAQSEVLTLREKLLEANTQTANLMAAFTAIESYPQANWYLIQKIFALADENITITLSSFQAQNGIFDITAVSKKVNSIPNFIRRAQNSGLFESVIYTGYGASEDAYSIFFQCVLHSSAGKEVLE